MLNTLGNSIKAYFRIPIGESSRQEFNEELYKINITRGKLTAISFLVLEVFTVILSFIVKKDRILGKPNLYYLIMYFLMITAMTVSILVFNFQEKNFPANSKVRNITEVSFCSFLLGWCAGITLIDQLTDGDIIVYMIASICIAVAPIYRPPVIFSQYFIIQALFLILLPHFNKSGNHLFGNYVNSTTIVTICWVISYMRYKNRAEDFMNRKELLRLNGELEEANRKLEILSQTDGLTGIYNRSMFDKVLKKEWKRCRKYLKPISLIMIDIDFFKAYNDNYGHQAGDECLKRVAEILSECTERSVDALVRYGGEEFAIVLPNMKATDASEYAEKMRNSVEKLKIRHEYSSVSDYITISLGVYTTVPDEQLTTDDFIRTADMALYEAKNTKRNKVVVA